MFIQKSMITMLVLGSVLVAGAARAADHNVTIAIRVDTRGLDPSKASDVQTLYSRLKTAARTACTHGNRVDLVPLDNPNDCYEKALAQAVRTVNASLLTQVYLANHPALSPALPWVQVAAAARK